jgi:hypothetical protein
MIAGSMAWDACLFWKYSLYTVVTLTYLPYRKGVFFIIISKLAKFLWFCFGKIRNSARRPVGER